MIQDDELKPKKTQSHQLKTTNKGSVLFFHCTIMFLSGILPVTLNSDISSEHKPHVIIEFDMLTHD